MPISYNISPNMPVVLYICRGLVTAAEFFRTADMVLVDKRRQPGMITIVDLLGAVEDFHLEDLYEATRRIDRIADEGYVPGPIALLSLSDGIHLLVDTLLLLPSRVPFRMRAFHSLEDAIITLGLSDFREDIIQFWHECNSVYEPA